MKIFAKKSVKSLALVLGAGALAAGLSVSPKASASEPFLAEVTMFASNFAPRGWAFCSGQILPIASNTALFSLLGTTYGGDGETTFALPDLRGRTAIHPGNGPGLSTYRLGEKGGAETVTLTQNQMPSHTHVATAVSGQLGSAMPPNSNMPGNRVLATSASTQIYTDAIPDRWMATNQVITVVTNGSAGGNQAHENRIPFLGVHHIIALVGIFPSRN